MKMKTSILSMSIIIALVFALGFSACNKAEEPPVIVSSQFVSQIIDKVTSKVTYTAIIQANIDSRGYKGYRVYVDYRTTEESVDKTLNMSSTKAGIFQANVAPLLLDKTYQYRIRIVTEEGDILGELQTFKTEKTIPEITVSTLKSTPETGTVSVNATLNLKDYPAKQFSVFCYYTEAKSAASKAWSVMSLSDTLGGYQAILKDLKPSTDYVYTINVSTGIYQTVGCDTLRFTSGTTPIISSQDVVPNAVTGLLTATATINNNNCNDYQVYVDYGLKGRYNTTNLMSSTSPGVYSYAFDNLISDTLYTYNIRLVTNSYLPVVNVDSKKDTTYMFQTQTSPILLSQKIILDDQHGIVAFEAVVDSKDRPDYNVFIDYGIDNYDSIRMVPVDGKDHFKYEFANLLPNTTYTYQVRMQTPSYQKILGTYSFKTGNVLSFEKPLINTFCATDSVSMQIAVNSNGFKQYAVSCLFDKKNLTLSDMGNEMYGTTFSGLKDAAYTYTIVATTPSYRLSANYGFNTGKLASIGIPRVFVDSATRTSADIEARITSDKSCGVNYTTSIDYGTDSANFTNKNVPMTIENSKAVVKLTNLLPETQYFYRIRLMRPGYIDVIKSAQFVTTVKKN
ncbi:MAG: hypothetical protein RRY15_07490 [Bacteroidales bacterium]